MANQLVYANNLQRGHHHENHDHDHTHDHEGENHSHSHSADSHGHSHDEQNEEGHSHTSGQQLRTNNEGLVEVKLPEDGIYYPYHSHGQCRE